jgi:small-conductance mechanosensitive channel
VHLFGLDEQTAFQLLGVSTSFLGTLLVTLLLRRWLLRWLYRANSDDHSISHVVAEGLRIPSIFWSIAAAIVLALEFTPLSQKYAHLASKLVTASIIISLTFVASSIALRAIQRYSERKGMQFAVAGLSRTLTLVFVWGIGLLVLLKLMGVSITPALTALGVGGLAVALALQDTLANFFAGVHILVETPIALGNYIRLNDQDEGTVIDIGWRTTRILNTSNNTIVVPNTKITSGILTNLSMPSAFVMVSIIVLTSLNADPQVARSCIMEALNETEGVLKEPGPIVLFDPGITPTHLAFKVVLGTERQIGSGLVRSNLYFLILQKFRQAGVALPERTS